MSQGRGKSDRGVVPKKLPNKAAGQAPAAAEAVEGRLRAKGNAVQQRMSRRSTRVYDVQIALDGIRQTARGRPGAKFTTLMHHIYQVERLRTAYMACKRNAAAGVDGQTWAGYGQSLEANLLDLSDRLARGGYRPQPVKRAYIDKTDGSKRPLGVPALEDKIVQRASVEVLGAIYEADFNGLQLRLQARPGARTTRSTPWRWGSSARRVNWILDADIAKFFDTIEHDWLMKFIEHRVADARVVRLIKKWLHAGVLEDGQIDAAVSWVRCRAAASRRSWPTSTCTTRSTCGSSSGGGAMPRGDVIIVRYADDWVAGFELRWTTPSDSSATRLRAAEDRSGWRCIANKTRLKFRPMRVALARPFAPVH